MSVLSYLSIPCSGSGSKLIIGGPLVLCPVTMNHEVATQLGEAAGGVEKGYWRELEERLAAACDDLVILEIARGERSLCVAREAALFANAGKPFLWMSGVDEPGVLPPYHACRVQEGSL